MSLRHLGLKMSWSEFSVILYRNCTNRGLGGGVPAEVGNEEENTSLQNDLTAPQSLLPSAVSTYDTPHQASLHRSPTPGIVIETTLPSPINPRDVDVPNDGKWDVIAAHEARFCFQHGEDEWLLESENKWMDPSDFDIPGAEAELEAKLQKYKSNRSGPREPAIVAQPHCNLIRPSLLP